MIHEVLDGRDVQLALNSGGQDGERLAVEIVQRAREAEEACDVPAHGASRGGPGLHGKMGVGGAGCRPGTVPLGGGSRRARLRPQTP